MKALAFLQPWAWAVLHAGKRIDNRRRKDGRMPAVCKHRGPLLIHASAGNGPRVWHESGGGVEGRERWSEPYFDWSVKWMFDRHLARVWSGGTTNTDPTTGVVPPACGYEQEHVRGGIVGRAVIDGVIHGDEDFAAYVAGVIGGAEQRPWWFGDFALVLRDVEPLPFVPWPGSLGLFEVPDHALRGGA